MAKFRLSVMRVGASLNGTVFKVDNEVNVIGWISTRPAGGCVGSSCFVDHSRPVWLARLGERDACPYRLAIQAGMLGPAGLH